MASRFGRTRLSRERDVRLSVSPWKLFRWPKKVDNLHVEVDNLHVEVQSLGLRSKFEELGADVYELVAQHLAPRDLHSLCLVSKHCNDHFTPALYRKLWILPPASRDMRRSVGHFMNTKFAEYTTSLRMEFLGRRGLRGSLPMITDRQQKKEFYAYLRTWSKVQDVRFRQLAPPSMIWRRSIMPYTPWLPHLLYCFENLRSLILCGAYTFHDADMVGKVAIKCRATLRTLGVYRTLNPFSGVPASASQANFATFWPALCDVVLAELGKKRQSTSPELDMKGKGKEKQMLRGLDDEELDPARVRPPLILHELIINADAVADFSRLTDLSALHTLRLMDTWIRTPLPAISAVDCFDDATNLRFVEGQANIKDKMFRNKPPEFKNKIEFLTTTRDNVDISIFKDSPAASWI